MPGNMRHGISEAFDLTVGGVLQKGQHDCLVVGDGHVG